MRQSESAGVRLAGAGATEGAARRAIPLRRRRRDLPFVGFFLLNLCFITYVVDVEQLIIADPANGQGGPANLANFCIGGSSVIDSFVKLDSTQRLSGVGGASTSSRRPSSTRMAGRIRS